MYRPPQRTKPAAQRRFRRGFTLVEMMSAMVVMVMIASALAVMSNAIEEGADYSQGSLEVSQHARVVIDRIEGMIQSARTSDDFPGFVVVKSEISTYQNPDSLVIWYPEAAVSDPDGLPLWREVVVICPDPNSPNRLLELTDRSNSTPVPAVDQSDSWERALDEFKSSDSTTAVELTHLIRAVTPTGDATETVLATSKASAVRFEARYLPTIDEWKNYEAQLTEWHELSWALGIYGSQTGMRHAWCSFEFQFIAESENDENANSREKAVPFFGSAARYFELHKND